jgi:hypothetical protein
VQEKERLVAASLEPGTGVAAVATPGERRTMGREQSAGDGDAVVAITAPRRYRDREHFVL